jgi:hypothetical protein
MNISKELKDAMGYLRLTAIIPTLPDRIAYANSKKITIPEFLEMIFYDELERRQANLLNTKMKKAGVDLNLESFDWDTTSSYDRELVKNLFSLNFISSHASVLIFGLQELVKLFLQNILHLYHLRQDIL